MVKFQGNKIDINSMGIIINNDLMTSWIDDIILPDNYTPNAQEEYMSDKQLKYFYNKLQDWKGQLISESDHTLDSLKEKHMQEPDDADRACSESDTNIELRTRERYLKLISKIEKAQSKIFNKTYGYCEDTGEEIGLKRLIARPIASYTVEAQELREQKEKQMHELKAASSNI